MRLQNKIALITGAGEGIGRGIAKRFAAEGARVGVLDIEAPRCEDTVSEIQSAGGQAFALVCDVRNPEQVRQAVMSLAAAFGPINVLVNNAAIMPSGRLHETSLEAVRRVIDVNLIGTYLVSREVLTMMMEQREGSIIHMASGAASVGAPGIAMYSATKGALVTLARAMAIDYAPYGIRVNSVSPGTIDSPMLHNFVAAQRNPARIRAAFDAVQPLGRVGTIDEVASVFVFLASDEASYVTGANYAVDGGSTIKGEQPQDHD